MSVPPTSKETAWILGAVLIRRVQGMTNHESRMTKEIRIPNAETLRSVSSLVSSLRFRHSFGFRHSSLVIFPRLDVEFAHQKRQALGGFLDDLAGGFARAVT